MNDDVETINLDTDLRRNLLFGFIGFVIAILIVFISVTHHIASDLGESIESEHIQTEVNKISLIIKDFINSDEDETHKTDQTFPEFFSHHDYFLDDDVALFNVWLSGQVYIIAQDESFNKTAEMEEALSSKTASKGLVKHNKNSF